MIDSNETVMYESGKNASYNEGYENCKNEMREIIESMAYEIARVIFPRQYEFTNEQIKSIMYDFGFRE